MTKRNFGDYLQDILTSINETEEFTKDMKFESFIRDQKTVNAVVRSLEVLGEASKNIPTSIKDEYPNVPWKNMAGMRDKLIHEYFGIDLEIVWQAVTKELPTIKPELTNIYQKYG